MPDMNLERSILHRHSMHKARIWQCAHDERRALLRVATEWFQYRFGRKLCTAGLRAGEHEANSV